MDSPPGIDQPGSDLPGTSGSQRTAEQLGAYVRANYGKFTDESLTAELLRAGFAADDIRAALQAAARGQVPSPNGRAMAVILGAYAVTFAVLSIGMLANTRGADGCCMPDATGGIILLAGSLGFALLLSMAWVGNRRLAALVFAVLLGLYGLGTLSSTGVASFVVIGIAILVIVVVLRRGPAPTTRQTTSLAALLSVPVILLVIVAGLCIATGLPIPQAG